MYSLLLTVSLVAAYPAPAAFQAQPDTTPAREVVVGERVRVRFPGPGSASYLTGTLEAIGSDSIALRASGRPRVLAREQVSQIARAAGKRSAWKTGMGFGLVIGGVTGGAIAGANYTPCPQDGWCIEFGQGAEIAVGAMLGAGIGGLAGAGLGAAIGKTRWEPSVLPGVGIGARVTLRSTTR